jgi:D-amino-acid oxidase
MFRRAGSGRPAGAADTVPRVSGREPDVLVIGAGVCGLTTAICLAEAGLEVTVRAARPPLETTSAAAGAIWGPHLVDEGGQVARWGIVTLEILRGLAGQPGTGVRTVQGIQASRHPAEPPGWLDPLPGWRRCGPAELPAGFVTGWLYAAPVLTMPVYLGYLLDRFGAAGGDVQVATVGSLAAAAADAPVVVNCTGIGARELVPDPGLRPVRGQAVIVANPGITDFFIGPAETGPDFVYMFPHGDTVLLGGTEQHGDWNLDCDPEISRRILARCTAVEPRLAGAEILEQRVGLRPVRSRVRFDTEQLEPGRLLVHNYGHGGSGVTLAWGCARDITRRVAGGA